jgi:hypothetical protein
MIFVEFITKVECKGKQATLWLMKQTLVKIQIMQLEVPSPTCFPDDFEVKK